MEISPHNPTLTRARRLFVEAQQARQQVAQQVTEEVEQQDGAAGRKAAGAQHVRDLARMSSCGQGRRVEVCAMQAQTKPNQQPFRHV